MCERKREHVLTMEINTRSLSNILRKCGGHFGIGSGKEREKGREGKARKVMMAAVAGVWWW